MHYVYFIIPLIVAVGILIFPFITFYGNNIMVVISDSMIPTLNPYDLIVIQESSIEDIKVDDIIAFDSHMEDLGIVVHRVNEKFVEEGIIGLDTKGDNVTEPDPWTVHDEDLIGKMIKTIPTIGIFLIEPVRYSLVAAIIITAVFLLKEVTSEKNKK